MFFCLLVSIICSSVVMNFLGGIEIIFCTNLIQGGQVFTPREDYCKCCLIGYTLVSMNDARIGVAVDSSMHVTYSGCGKAKWKQHLVNEYCKSV